MSAGPAPAAGSASGHAEQQRQTATAVVHATYRLVKSCSLHSDTNQTVVAAATGAATLVAELATGAELDAITLLFTPNAVFVNGRILKSTRETFALASELGSMLEACDVTELTLSKDVPPVELAQLARMIADAQRDKALGAKLREAQLTGIRVRKVTGFGADSGRKRDDSTPAARAVRTYAMSVVVMGEFFAALRAGDRTLPNRVKRVAQKLVAHAEEDSRRLVSLTAAAATHPGPAALAVGTTVLAIAIGKQLTTDRRVLGSLAQAALLYDAGRVRLLGAGEGLAAERDLSDGELDRTPASEIHVLTAIGRIHQPAMARNVIAYEALRLRRQATTGPAYGGRRPTCLAAHILATARVFVELRAFQPGVTGLGIDESIQLLLSRADSAQQRTVVKLLVGALGIFPAGTLVELSTGEQAVVLATPALPIHFARPPVRILYDGKARLLDEPFDRDLAAKPSAGEPLRFIRRTIDADETQMKAMRAYVASAATSRRRTESGPLSPEALRSVYNKSATTDVMRMSRSGEDSRARILGATEGPTPSPSSAKARVASYGSSSRVDSSTAPSSTSSTSSTPSTPSTPEPRSPPSSQARAPLTPSPRTMPSARTGEPLTPPPRTMPPLTYRPVQPPTSTSRGSEPRSAPRSQGRVGTLDSTSTEGLPGLDTGLPLADSTPSRAGQRGPRAWADDDRRREPDAPDVSDALTRMGSVDLLSGRPEVEYEADGATRQASWNELGELLGQEAPATRPSESPPAPRSSTLQDRIDALGLSDGAPQSAPSSGRSAPRHSEPEHSEPARMGSGSAHDLLLAAYLADTLLEAPPARVADRSKTPRQMPAPPSESGPRSSQQQAPLSHGLRWNAVEPSRADPDGEATPSNEELPPWPDDP